MKLIRINSRKGQIILHVAAWLIVFSLPYLLRPYNPNRPRDQNENGFFYLTFFTGFFWMILFYLNAYFFTRYLLYQKKYALYALLLLATYGVIMFCHSLLFLAFIDGRRFNLMRSAGFNMSAFLLTVAISIIYKIFLDKAQSQKLVREKHEENLKTELYFLRSQISPHFIFNVLNNIVALARMKSDQLEPTVMKLSSLMQYMLYETDEEKVTLQIEAGYLQSYIDLQMQRFGGKVKITNSMEINDDSLFIEPMLIIPFVENAFKHGVGMIAEPEIDIKLYTENNVLDFSIRNRYSDLQTEVKDKTSGIGLPNVMRRLNLLYKNQHDLIISKNDNWFSVSLKLKLH